jgi:hypothetical protein
MQSWCVGALPQGKVTSGTGTRPHKRQEATHLLAVAGFWMSWWSCFLTASLGVPVVTSPATGQALGCSPRLPFPAPDSKEGSIIQWMCKRSVRGCVGLAKHMRTQSNGKFWHNPPSDVSEGACPLDVAPQAHRMKQNQRLGARVSLATMI